MKTLNKLIYTIAVVVTCCFATKVVASQNTSPIKDQNFSLWSEYKRNQFEDLTQAEKTEKLRNTFKDKLAFVQKHGIRRLIVKILDPTEFEFFHPNNFDVESEDNFYFWACQLANHVSIEALFDLSQFKLVPESIFDRLADGYSKLRDYFGKQENPFGEFKNIIEKMKWVSWANEIYGAKERNRALISGITIDPKGIGNSIAYYQNLVNAFDQFRFQMHQDCSVSEWIPQNSYSTIKVAMLLPLDMKDFALANAANFPLTSDIRAYSNSLELGIHLPQNFPSEGPNYAPPPWRSLAHCNPLLDTVYINLGDSRLTPYIFQNYDILPHPDREIDAITIQKLCNILKYQFKGLPFAKGPGFISNLTSSSTVMGTYTFFRTGSSHGEGQFVPNQQIVVFSPLTSEKIVRTVTNLPKSNREMQISSSLSTTTSFENVEYWLTAIPGNWITPKISNNLGSKIYFVLSTAYDSEKEKFFGNWCIENFLTFLRGFQNGTFFKNLNGELVKPYNNLVLYDFSTIPNGKPFPEVNWGLGNQNY